MEVKGKESINKLKAMNECGFFSKDKSIRVNLSDCWLTDQFFKYTYFGDFEKIYGFKLAKIDSDVMKRIKRNHDDRYHYLPSFLEYQIPGFVV